MDKNGTKLNNKIKQYQNIKEEGQKNGTNEENYKLIVQKNEKSKKK